MQMIGFTMDAFDISPREFTVGLYHMGGNSHIATTYCWGLENIVQYAREREKGQASVGAPPSTEWDIFLFPFTIYNRGAAELSKIKIHRRQRNRLSLDWCLTPRLAVTCYFLTMANKSN